MASAHLSVALALALSLACGNSPESSRDRLSNADPDVRREAVIAIAKSNDTSAVPELVERMNSDGSDEVRAAAARALGKLGDVRASPALADVVAGPGSLDVRAAAVTALGELRDPNSIPAMISVWKLDAATNKNGVIHEGVRYTLRDIAELSYDPLIAALRDEHPSVRSYAADTLGLIGDKRARDAIALLANDPDANVRREAKLALERLAEP